MLGNVLTAIATPFRENGAVDFEAFHRRNVTAAYTELEWEE